RRAPRGPAARAPHPCPAGPPPLHGLLEGRGPGWRQLRLPPAEQVAGAEAAGGERGFVRDLRLPGQLERPAACQVALPLPGPEVRRRPVLRELAGLDQLGPPLVRLAPQEVGGLGDVAGLVEDEEGAGVERVEAPQ